MNSTVYLVVEPIEIITSDLALNEQDYDEGTTIVVANTPQEALAAPADRDSVRFAFALADPTGFDKTELGRALAALTASCVFMGDAAERAKKAMIVLDRPFSSLTVATLLAQPAENSPA